MFGIDPSSSSKFNHTSSRAPQLSAKSFVLLIVNSAALAIVVELMLMVGFLFAKAAGLPLDAQVQGIAMVVGFPVAMCGAFLLLERIFLPRGWLAAKEREALGSMSHTASRTWSALTGSHVPEATVFRDLNEPNETDKSIIDVQLDTEPQVPFEIPGRAPTPPSKVSLLPAPDVAGERVTEISDACLDTLKEFVFSVRGSLRDLLVTSSETFEFAVELILAGACSQYARARSMSRATAKTLLRLAVEQVGRDRRHGDELITNVEYYAQYASTRLLIDAGRAAASAKIAGDSQAFLSLPNIVELWSRDEKRPMPPVQRTLLFTEIADFAALSLRMGTDINRLIEHYNAIVQWALETYGGSEMERSTIAVLAQFEDVDAAMAAAVSIQQEVDLISREQAGIAFEVKAALVMGEVSNIEDSWIGRSIQVGGSICEATVKGEVWCDQHVANALPDYKQDRISYVGELDGVGLDGGRITLFQIQWDPIQRHASGRPVEYGQIGDGLKSDYLPN